MAAKPIKRLELYYPMIHVLTSNICDHYNQFALRPHMLKLRAQSRTVNPENHNLVPRDTYLARKRAKRAARGSPLFTSLAARAPNKSRTRPFHLPTILSLQLPLKTLIKTYRKVLKPSNLAYTNDVSIGTNFAQNMAYRVPISCVRLARYFPYGAWIRELARRLTIYKYRAHLQLNFPFLAE